MATTTCPLCGKFGSSKLSDHCTPCYQKRYRDKDERSIYDDFDGFGSDREFFPDDFGIEKDKFGIEK